MATLTKKEIGKVWTKYKRERNEQLRNLLIEAYLPLVKYTAERISAKLPGSVEADDLASAGIFGLMDAIERYDLTREIKFETYCASRIRGAMLDELRSLDWVPRMIRNRSHKVDAASHRLRSNFGRNPTDLEVAGEMKCSVKEVEEVHQAQAISNMVSLNRKIGDSDGQKDIRRIEMLEDKRGVDPVRNMHRKELKDILMKGLSEKERLIIILYYYEELTMKEIGAALDLSESRVCQIHSSVIKRLKKRLDKVHDELAP